MKFVSIFPNCWLLACFAVNHGATAKRVLADGTQVDGLRYILSVICWVLVNVPLRPRHLPANFLSPLGHFSDLAHLISVHFGWH